MALAAASLTLSIPACAPSEEGSRAPQVDTTTRAGGAATATADERDDEAAKSETAPEGSAPQPPRLRQAYADRTARSIMAEVARARALSADGSWSVDVIDHAGVRAFVKTALYEDTTPEELLLLGKVQAALGVLPVNADPESVLLDMYEQGVLGIYDPKTQTLLIGDFIPPSMLEMVVGHELAHGVQDMHFDLEALQQPLRAGPAAGLNDAETARTFLIEGDAQAAYLTWRGGPAGPASIEDDVLDVLADQALGIDERFTPYPTLARMMQMPYTDGTATVIRLARTRGWGAVDDLFGRLPETSEQMLHVDKLLRREGARPVEIDPSRLETALPGYRPVWEDDLGEAAILAMLADVEPVGTARDAAAGWGGDRLVALRPEGADPHTVPAVVGLVAWDTEDDARAFEISMRRYLEHAVDAPVLLERKRDRVLYATFLPASSEMNAVSTAAWAAFKVRRRSKGGR